jgi:parvulin-like peptidyl-prolyl isomerase
MKSNEVIHHFRNIYGKGAASLNNLPVDRLKTEIEKLAYDLSVERLILRELEREKIRISDSELDSVLELQYARAGSREAFLKELDEREIKFEFVKKDIEEGLLIDRFIKTNVYSEVLPPDENQLKQMYSDSNKELVTFRILVLSVRDKTEDEIAKAKKKAQNIWNLARNGTPLEKLIKMHSEDESSRQNGGLYENFERGMMDPPMEAVLFNTPVGQISEVFETVDGLNIVKVESRHIIGFEEFKERNLKTLWQKRKNKTYHEYLNKIKSDAQFTFLGL